ncbi:acyl-CoA/acyl-ACP dehydrogenase [Amycolatopsis rubida]|uniref:Acyl-CoA/acyl-ACP dehydrogenase n=1 Tax=Amycolatopsis rubida TaxID=112413 RepID=A0ABX0C884_9PSEU|nr:acyl-CoA dehydrogenase family protein [Amycolatopsis sp. M39]MYW97937.1 acyl-CoA dehydrogenase [Amycolatopsis rubida]NEC62922.1 acyl-CoA/acyl-ACP dehydrogenase [Amycolatopsis rubida]OAP24935.1 Acryloyl-CoA reductase (NADH) [Amycolatopsis sp. M39]
MLDVTGKRAEIADMVRSRWGTLLDKVGETVVERDEARLPPPADLMGALAAAGYHRLSLPPDIGGTGADVLTWGMVLEQVGYRCLDSALPMIVNHAIDIARFIHESGRPGLIEKYAEPIGRGAVCAGVAYTEDADAWSFRTVLRRKGGDFVLSGHKSYVTAGVMSDVFLVYPLDETGDMVACLVERSDPGVTVTPAEPVGMRTAGAASLTFQDVPLTAERILEPSDGLTHAQRFLSDQRLWITCAPLGRAQRVLEDCVAWLSGSVRYGEPVAGLKNVESTLGRMYVAIESSRAMLYHALSHVEAGRAEPVFDPTLSAAKCFAADQIRFVLESALRVMGGQGFYGTPHLGRFLRDFTGLPIVAGTNDILEVNLGAGVVARSGRHKENGDRA